MLIFFKLFLSKNIQLFCEFFLNLCEVFSLYFDFLEILVRKSLAQMEFYMIMVMWPNTEMLLVFYWSSNQELGLYRFIRMGQNAEWPLLI